MTYSIKEIYYTLQGEGAQVGRPAVFCRFTGCNLWSGHEEDRSKAICQFCDTDFIGTDGPGGGKFEDAKSLAQAVKLKWPNKGDSRVHPYVVCTGGEPLLQLDTNLVDAFHEEGIEVAIETNGTCPAPVGLDWICVSPKADAEIVIQNGDELKLVFPQETALPDRFEHLDFDHFFLQPMDGPDLVANTQKALEYCKSNPRWKLSLQIHKVLGIP
ncbi:MAG: 7-carboxy-7-deazaguanine synthase [Gammaproteobacteria bacterium]|nr:7-carboxy-7-deazaguanine synthase [Gammaproteobacteria bacterium]